VAHNNVTIKGVGQERLVWYQKVLFVGSEISSEIAPVEVG
jgi:hypothetical protein